MQLLLMLIFLFNVESYKILVIFGHNGYSHLVPFIPLLSALKENGHNLTVISYYPLSKDSISNRDIVLPPSKYRFEDLITYKFEASSVYDIFLRAHMTIAYGENTCKSSLSSQAYKNELESEERYDLILTEFFNTNCLLLPLIEKHKVPFIGLSSHTIMPWVNEWIGNPDNPAYIPSLFIGYWTKMAFAERSLNALMLILYNIAFKCVEGKNKKFTREQLGDHFELSEANLYNVSLVLVNTHFTVQGGRPMVPNVVEIGGIHIKNGKKLPAHIEKWINESEHGVIYFSLGSMIKGHTFPEDKKQMFIKAFSRLPQRVLWKWENDTMTGKTDNIMIEKWMPQFDILCHPNVKVFVAHGGMLGVTEAVHCGVPMVIMPQYGDQFTNAKAVEANGGGLILDYSYLDEESIYNALTTALDPKFNQKAKELSARFKDRPMPPLETAIYWIEYVARHGGAPHLRTAAVGMPLYQYLLLDVIAFLAVILLSIVFMVYYTCRAVFRKLCKRSPKKVKKN